MRASKRLSKPFCRLHSSAQTRASPATAPAGATAEAGKGRPASARTTPTARRAIPQADPSEGPEWYRPRPLIGRRRGGVASGVWFRAPQLARRIASRVRSGRHGEEWWWYAGDAKAAIWAWFGPEPWPEPGIAVGVGLGRPGDRADAGAPAFFLGAAARAVRARGRLRAAGAEGSGGDQPAAAAGGCKRWAWGLQGPPASIARSHVAGHARCGVR